MLDSTDLWGAAKLKGLAPCRQPILAGFLVWRWRAGLLSGWLAATFGWQDSQDRQAFWHLAICGMASCLWQLAWWLCNVLINLML